MLAKYIGFKMVQAEPMTLGEYNKFRGWAIPADENPDREGYKVTYPDGYVSWCPKEIFEKANMQVSDKNTITGENVEDFIGDYISMKFENKTTIVKATLVNGFEIVESSSCVDPANYDHNIGVEVCLVKIRNKIWELLGFLLQTAKDGIK